MHPTALSRLAALLLALPLATLAADLKLPASEQFTLDNGLEVILTPKTDVPLVAAELAVRGGALADAPGKEGTASLLADLLGKGAGPRDATAFVDAVADAGGSLSFTASREAIWASADFLAADAPLMLELLADASQRPALAQDDFDKLRTRAIQSLAAMKEGDPRGLVSVYGNAWLFRGHPYGRPVQGDEHSLAAISLADVQAFHANQTGADRATLSIVGDFAPAAMRQAVERAFGGWRKAGAALPQVPMPVRDNGPRVLLVDKPGATQSYFWIGTVGAAVDDPATEAQDLVQTLFGGRFTSMLNTELRVKSGLTYGARASLDRLARPGAAAYSSFTRTDATQQAIDLALAVQQRLHEHPIAPDQLESARQYVLGQFAPEYETNAQLATALAALALHGQSRDRIEGYGARLAQVTPDAAMAARGVFPQGRDYAMVVIGDGAKIADLLTRYGPVTRIAIDAPGFAPAAPH